MSASKPDVLLLGGGYTLSKLAEVLGVATVLITHRSSAKTAEDRAKGFSAETLDVLQQGAIAKLLADYPTIRYVVDSVPPVVSAPADGPLNVVEALKRSSVKGIVYLSSTGVYGGTDGRVVDEATEPQPNNWRGRNRLVCEEVYRSSGIPVASLRLSGIYGADRGLIQSLRAGRYQLKYGRWSNRIHVDDIVQALEWLLRSVDPQNWPPVLNISDDEPALVEEVVQFYCSKLGLRYPALLEGEPAPDSFYSSNQRVDNSKFKTLSGLTLKYPNYKTILEGHDG